jgi:hypothetical protein
MTLVGTGYALLGFLLGTLLGMGLLELFFWQAIKLLKPRFPWLITVEDRDPKITPKAVEKYFERSFDSRTGWRRKSGQKGQDETETGPTSFAIERGGWRSDPQFTDPPTSIVAFGDSFTFCRLVNDDETWPHFLSRHRKTHVANFGVGNFGLDQALLLAEEEIPKFAPKVAILGIVPETIARCRSRWKHYFEYGNTLAFKPSFRMVDSVLEFVDSPVRTRNDFELTPQDLKNLEASDYFYTRKFSRDLIQFPYTLSIARRLSRNAPIFWYLLISHFLGPRAKKWGWKKAFDVIMRENTTWTAALYKDEESKRLLASLIDRFAEFCEKHDCDPVLLVIPQPSDLKNSDGMAAYQAFYRTMGNRLQVIDMTDVFAQWNNPAPLFIAGALGPHCSVNGNRLIARAVHQAISAQPSVAAVLHD